MSSAKYIRMKRTLLYQSISINKLLIVIIMCLPLWNTKVLAGVAYAIFDKATKTITFKYGEQRPPKSMDLYYEDEDDDIRMPEFRSLGVEKVIFDSSFAKVRLKSCRAWFNEAKQLKYIVGLNNLNTEKVTDMSEMFFGCTSLKDLNLSNLNTKNVTNMAGMFNRCTNLTNLNLTNFNTENVTDMGAMFMDCTALTSLDLSLIHI